jgi:hypothetical protein
MAEPRSRTVLSFERFVVTRGAIEAVESGKVAPDEIKLTRKVGDFATEEFVAKRVKD